jgi:hypothetical protein
MGRRSPYASLPSVDAFRRRQASGPERNTCATCCHRSGRADTEAAPHRRYAYRAFAAHGLEVPEVSTYGARAYVAQCIEDDRTRGIPICPLAEAFAMGRRSPYASLLSVDAFRRPKESGPERKTCVTCRHRSAVPTPKRLPIVGIWALHRVMRATGHASDRASGHVRTVSNVSPSGCGSHGIDTL